MSPSIIKSALAALTLILPFVLAGPIGARMNPNENVLLTYCRDNNQNIINAQMGYFSGAPNGFPDATTIVNGPVDIAITDLPEIARWESGSLTGNFPDGNYFTSLIRFAVEPAAYAGLGTNKYGPFACYAYDPSKPQYYYTDSAGLTCLEAYICNHTPPASDPEYINFEPSTGTVTLQNTQATSAGSILAMASNIFSNGICTPGNSQTIDSNGCTISFTCNANTNTVLQNMLSFLVGTVSHASSFASYSMTSTPPSPPCQSQDGCPTPPPSNLYYTTIPQSFVMDTNYMETPYQLAGLTAATLEYEITCPAAKGCFACYLLEEFLTGVALVPGLGTAAGVAAVGATAYCQQTQGC
jgi:hypothetical protein